MVTTLYLVRHGETEGSEIPRYKGSIDVPLSARGHEQVRRTAARVREHLATVIVSQRRSYLNDVHELVPTATDDEQLAAVYCSPLIRAKASADLIAAPHAGVQPAVNADLRERHFGVWEGMSFSEIKAAYPDDFASWAADPVQFSPTGGESTLAVSHRAVAAIEALLARHPGQRLAVVAHGGVNRVILCHFLGLPLANIFRIEQDLACFNVIEFWDGYPVLKLLNG